MLWKPVPKMIVSTGCCSPAATTPSGVDPLDGVGDHLDVGLQERRVPVVRDEDALAADRVVGDQRLPAQLGRHHLLEALREAALEHAWPTREPGLEDGEAGVEPHPDRGAVGPLGHGEAAHERPGPIGDRPVGLGTDVVARSLEEGDRPGLLGDLRHELDGARPDADHGDVALGQVVVVVPAGRVELVAGEVVEAGRCRGRAAG